MIFCKLAEIERYKGIRPDLAEAIQALLSCDLNHLPTGHIQFTDQIYGNVIEYTTCDNSDLFFETHTHYADIHIALSGTEVIFVADVLNHDVVEQDEKNDYIGTKGEWESCFRLTPGYALIVFPGEAHKLKGMREISDKVKKLVIKFPGC